MKQHVNTLSMAMARRGCRNDSRLVRHLATWMAQFPLMADTVAKVFCGLWRATSIRNDEPQRNFDSLQPGF
jgi:hypothetical protein